MIVLPRPHDLPGTDSRFHEARKYLSVVTYKGREIIASNGSCKEEGCGYSSAWTSNRARDLGMWQHRALNVREARMIYFNETFHGDNLKIARAFEETADRHSHPYSSWWNLVAEFMQDMANTQLTEMPKAKYQTEYDLGNAAYAVAKAVLDKAYS